MDDWERHLAAKKKKQRHEDFWRTFRGTSALIVGVVLLLLFMANCPKVG